MRRATGSININVSQIAELGKLWDSDKIKSVSESLASITKDANAGNISGNRMFYANDYMVHPIIAGLVSAKHTEL